MAGFRFGGRSISFKIMSGLVVVVAIGAISSVFGVFSIKGIGGELKNIAEDDIVISNQLSSVTEKQLEQAVLFGFVIALSWRSEACGSARSSKLEPISSKVLPTLKAGLKASVRKSSRT